jgi:pimeloyl-ACP methyl ester carboxylesterase
MNVRFNRRALAVLAGGFLLRAVVSPVGAAQGTPARIEQSSFVSIGGIDQWISIRGEDRRNPALLVVHGGPGEAQWMAADKYEPWEKAFTVVQWDQRGTGHTYGRYGTQTPDVTLDRIVKDGIEVADHLRRTLRKKKIIVLGHSWGSTVAVRMVQLRPELFAAYVGTGQVASWNAQVNMQFDLLLATTRRNGDDVSVKELEAIGRPDPANAKQYFAFSKGLGAVMAPADQAWLKALRANAFAMMARNDKDVQDLGDGMNFRHCVLRHPRTGRRRHAHQSGGRLFRRRDGAPEGFDSDPGCRTFRIHDGFQGIPGSADRQESPGRHQTRRLMHSGPFVRVKARCRAQTSVDSAARFR